MITLPDFQQTFDKFCREEWVPPEEHEEHSWRFVEAIYQYAYSFLKDKPIGPMTKEEIDVLMRETMNTTLEDVLAELRAEETQ